MAKLQAVDQTLMSNRVSCDKSLQNNKTLKPISAHEYLFDFFDLVESAVILC
ncbi:hypothetical protein ACLOJK_018460 [Asimina triloba]